ncbi:hypothetical protein VNO78_28134 [Psophocarpus tetragonolobus]|uniref:S-protein homolog n=1 Tax=Psophocarpus tetragonolobus TaxID=3891 RepID=A0AAN9XBB0_PSOTE
MCRSICVGVLLSLGVCQISLTFADSLAWNRDSKFDIKINILLLSMVNDIVPTTGRLTFISDFQATEYELEPGEPFVKLTNFEVHDCIMIWNSLCAKFDLYNPSREGGHQRIYWSARRDGVYHSWNNATWDKNTGWGPC